VLKGGDGRIYAGTSEGVFTLEGAVMKKLDNQIGYLTLNKKGSPAIDHNGIRYHDQSTYARMLPYPTEIRDEYHAGTEEFFYITSAGRMYIYEILPYELRYRNHSVRTTSHNFIGTYSGLYYRGRKLESPSSGFPPFTDGYIRGNRPTNPVLFMINLMRNFASKLYLCRSGFDCAQRCSIMFVVGRTVA
jgi:hypothetical protein